MASSVDWTGLASMKPMGWKSFIRAWLRRPAAARATTSGREPRSMLARRTDSTAGAPAVAGGLLVEVRLPGGGGGFGDSFFDEGLFDAGAHIAGGEFDEVLRFVGSSAGEEIEEEAQFGRGAAGFGDSGEGGFDFGEGDGGGGGCTAVEEVGGGGSEVAVTAIGGGHIGLGGAGEFCYGLAQQRAPDVEDALVGFGEGGAGEPEGGASRVRNGEGAEVVGDEGAFFEFFGGGGEGVAELGEVEEQGHGVQRSAYSVQPGAGSRELGAGSREPGYRFGWSRGRTRNLRLPAMR
jgi:hypothetical protein